MENNGISGKITQFFSSIIEKLQEQTWFQELKSKWDDLDPQSRSYAFFGGLAFAILAVLLTLSSLYWNILKIKSDLGTKTELLTLIRSAQDELKRLEESNSNAQASARSTSSTPWNNYFESLATSNSIDPKSLNISPEKSLSSLSPKESSKEKDTPKESHFEIGLKKVNIRQIVRFAFSLENGIRPVKLKNLLIDTKNDSSGYMDAQLTLSAFSFPSTQ